MNRRNFFQYSAVTAAFLFNGCESKQDTKHLQKSSSSSETGETREKNMTKTPQQNDKESYQKFSQKLKVPETIDFSDTQEAAFTTQKLQSYIYPQQKTQLLSFSKEFPNPTIKIPKGERFQLQFTNDLPDPTIIHWHGLIVPESMDGHPKDVITRGKTKKYHYQVQQEAGTFWYHTHPHGRTGKEIYHGLAGVYIIEDEKEKELDLPTGKFDLPLMIQDRRFDANKQLVYKQTDQDNRGVNGDVVLVNATPFPYHDVSSRKYRLRLVNASSVRTYNLHFDGLKSFMLIGTDSGLLEEAIEVEELMLGVAERVDIIVDFKDKEIGDVVTLKTSGVKNATNMDLHPDYPALDAAMDIMQFKVTQKSKKSKNIPKKLTTITRLQDREAVKTRTITMQIGKNGVWTLDDKRYDIDRIDQRVKLNTTEIWEIKNSAHMAHPFHMHAVKFQILDRDSGKELPTDKGWKDTVLVMPLETVRIIVHFTMPGLFLYHCHILEHEDKAMMANYLVEE